MKNIYDDLDRLDKQIKKWGCNELDKEPCFAEEDLKTCLILKEKDCYGCKFYKTIDQLDEINKELLEIERRRLNCKK